TIGDDFGYVLVDDHARRNQQFQFHVMLGCFGLLRRKSLRFGLRIFLLVVVGLILHLVDTADHVKRAFWLVVKLVVHDSLAASERVVDSDHATFLARELFGGEEGLC